MGDLGKIKQITILLTLMLIFLPVVISGFEEAITVWMISLVLIVPISYVWIADYRKFKKSSFKNYEQYWHYYHNMNN